ncbi:ferrochelatase [Chitinophaga terrae (ex Kim and Jung 2007)]|uniref:Ferrochelatase n=1 Tax=Chitinophaga terrae (ex Kim and Jung 2007) TaxID=408074 RepID=A0A1H4BZZ4_9BACT|nr:ferrochelatase [Chitinophaga terrae (ex Kim and Jung 2007)]GEP91951.1 ferrochelatase [Chitinophaga terrae (ex Kim and Jung 2007)]SEA53761.1 ferrochelatase [Chitinophaga terrae (ex Kim and Jung 2007)]
MAAKSDVGIVLMNLGSPDSTAVPDVKRYLIEFLMDKRVIDYPWLFRKILIEGIIVPRRAPKSAEAYASIWWEEGSPLIVLTKQLQKAVQNDMEIPVQIAMRYGNPSPEVAYNNLLKENPNLKEVIVLPLYPHYAMSSYETAAVYAEEVHKKKKYKFKLSIIPPFYDEPDYINAMAESMRPYLQQDYDYVLFSYHGVPERHIYKGDITGAHCLKVNDCCHVASPAHKYCYRHQVTVTAELVARQLGLPREKWGISFQSRLGREEWIKPYTANVLETLPSEGKKRLLVVCPAFVSDCLETLEEIAVEGKHTFLNSGGESFTMIPCLNIHPLWVKAVVKYCEQIIAQ